MILCFLLLRIFGQCLQFNGLLHLGGRVFFSFSIFSFVLTIMSDKFLGLRNPNTVSTDNNSLVDELLSLIFKFAIVKTN